MGTVRRKRFIHLAYFTFTIALLCPETPAFRDTLENPAKSCLAIARLICGW